MKLIFSILIFIVSNYPLISQQLSKSILSNRLFSQSIEYPDKYGKCFSIDDRNNVDFLGQRKILIEAPISLDSFNCFHLTVVSIDHAQSILNGISELFLTNGIEYTSIKSFILTLELSYPIPLDKKTIFELPSGLFLAFPNLVDITIDGSSFAQIHLPEKIDFHLSQLEVFWTKNINIHQNFLPSFLISGKLKFLWVNFDIDSDSLFFPHITGENSEIVLYVGPFIKHIKGILIENCSISKLEIYGEVIQTISLNISNSKIDYISFQNYQINKSRHKSINKIDLYCSNSHILGFSSTYSFRKLKRLSKQACCIEYIQQNVSKIKQRISINNCP